MSPETPEEMRSRLELMCERNSDWDLSDNDKAAIRWALNAIANLDARRPTPSTLAAGPDLEKLVDAVRAEAPETRHLIYRFGWRECCDEIKSRIAALPSPAAPLEAVELREAAQAVVDAQQDLRSAAADVDPEDGPEMYAHALSVVSERESDLEKAVDKLGRALVAPSEGKEKGPGDSWKKVRSVLWLYIHEDEATVDEATQKVLDALQAPGEKGKEEG